MHIHYVKETGESNQLYFTVKDHLNSTWALIDESGAIEEHYAFDPCSRFFQTYKRSAVGLEKNRNLDEEQRNREGKRVNPTNWDVEDARTNLILDIGFTGHEHLDELGLINMKARMYDPILGQFISPDPYVLDEGLSINYNRYAYCLNNPLKYTDPTGMWWYQDEDGDWYEKNDPNTKDDDYDSQGRRRYDENGVLIPESERGDPVYDGSPDFMYDGYEMEAEIMAKTHWVKTEYYLKKYYNGNLIGKELQSSSLSLRIGYSPTKISEGSFFEIDGATHIIDEGELTSIVYDGKIYTKDNNGFKRYETIRSLENTEFSFFKAMKKVVFGDPKTFLKRSGPYKGNIAPSDAPHHNLLNDLDFYDWYMNHEDPEYAREWVIENIVKKKYPFLYKKYKEEEY